MEFLNASRIRSVGAVGMGDEAVQTLCLICETIRHVSFRY